MKSEWAINSIDLVSKAIDLHGPTVAGLPELLEAELALIGVARVIVAADGIEFADISNGLTRLLRGEVSGRLVARLTRE